MNIKTFERKIEVNDKIEVIELSKTLIFKASIGSKLYNKNIILSKKDAENIYDDIYNLPNQTNKPYVYLDDYMWDLVNKTGFYNNKTLETFYDHVIDPVEAIKLPNFDENKIVKFDYSSYLLYKVDEINPISLPYKMGYIGGITNDAFNLTAVEEDFRNNSNILWMTTIDIPYYNSDDGSKTKALEFTAKLTQALHDNLCNYFRDIAKDKYWMCRIKDCLVWKPWYDECQINLDILGLKKHYKGKI